MNLSAKHPDRPGFRPLYQQVRDLLRARISTGAWRPAEALPSEQALAGELGVSQGTVRKALDSLAAERLVERRQGKGTYVAQHTQESAMFRFLKLFHDDDEKVAPAADETRVQKRAVKKAERDALGLAPREDVYALRRVRSVKGAPALLETIVVPATVFPALDSHQPLPNTLYTLYESAYGVTIVEASEKIRAVAADEADAKLLKLKPGAPLIDIERTAADINDRPVEYRRSRFSTETLHYGIELK